MPLIETPDGLGKLLGHLQGLRTPAEDTIQETSDLFTPYRGDIYTRNNPGQRRKPLYDTFGVNVATRFTNFLNGELFPSSSDWVGLRAFGMRTDVHTIEVALDDTSKRVMDALADSNFYSVSNVFTADWGVLGNATVMPQHDNEAAEISGDEFGGLLFDAVAWSRSWWIFSHVGRPLVNAREFEMPAIDVLNFFDKEGDRIPQYIRDEYNRDPFAMVRYYHIVQRNPKGKYGTAKKPWMSHWVTVENGNHIIRKAGFDLQPYVIARMLVFDGDQYGRGMGQIGRPQMKFANELSRQNANALGKEVSPPFLSEDGSIINFDAGPSGHIVVQPPREMAPGYLRSGTDFKIVMENLAASHQIVSDVFLGDALGEPDTQERSAAATVARHRRAIGRLSGASQTMDHELLSPLIENVVDIMLKRGALPELQAVIRDHNGVRFRPVFSSPFYVAMKSMSLERIDAFLEKRLQLFERTGEFGPLFVEDIDIDALREETRELAGVPAGIFKGQEEIEQDRRARGQMNAIRELAALQDRQTQVNVQPGRTGSRPASSGSLVQAATGLGAA